MQNGLCRVRIDSDAFSGEHRGYGVRAKAAKASRDDPERSFCQSPLGPRLAQGKERLVRRAIDDLAQVSAR